MFRASQPYRRGWTRCPSVGRTRRPLDAQRAGTAFLLRLAKAEMWLPALLSIRIEVLDGRLAAVAGPTRVGDVVSGLDLRGRRRQVGWRRG